MRPRPSSIFRAPLCCGGDTESVTHPALQESAQKPKPVVGSRQQTCPAAQHSFPSSVPQQGAPAAQQPAPPQQASPAAQQARPMQQVVPEGQQKGPQQLSPGAQQVW